MGRRVTITEPETDADGFFPKGPASICIEGPPQQQCYTAPGDFGRVPTAEVVQVSTGLTALLFSATSGGVSGFAIQFALLQPGTGKQLENLFLGNVEVSNQSQHAFWSEPEISDSKIFVTADYAWGPDESHYSPHRFIIRAYVRTHSSLIDGSYYYLDDQFMTVRKYDLDANADVLISEKPEILSRLKRTKASAEPRNQVPARQPRR
jgi:hypothetical protein